MKVLEYGDIVRTKRGCTDWIVLTSIKDEFRSTRYLCLYPVSNNPIITRYRSEVLIKQNYYKKTKRKMYEKVINLNSYNGKWADYLRKNPISDSFFDLKISEPNSDLIEKINIRKKYCDNSISYVHLKVKNTNFGTVESALRDAFKEIFEKESEIIELSFGGIIYEGGLDSIWINRSTTRSWTQKRGESFYTIDTDEYDDTGHLK